MNLKDQTNPDRTSRVTTALAEIARAMYTLIASKPEGIPSGHLYALCMGMITLDAYTLCITALVDAGLITNSGHLLQAIER